MLLMTLPRGIHARVHAYMRHSSSRKTTLQRALQQLTTRVMTSPWTLAPPLVRVRNSAEKEAVVAASKLAPSLSVSQNPLYLSQETTLAIISYQGFLRGIIEVALFFLCRMGIIELQQRAYGPLRIDTFPSESDSGTMRKVFNGGGVLA